jgi:hypothetical protein
MKIGKIQGVIFSRLGILLVMMVFYVTILFYRIVYEKMS